MQKMIKMIDNNQKTVELFVYTLRDKFRFLMDGEWYPIQNGNLEQSVFDVVDASFKRVWPRNREWWLCCLAD